LSDPVTRPGSKDVLRAEALLHAAPLAFVSFVEADAPYVVPLNFAYVPARPETYAPDRVPGPPQSPGPYGQLVLHSGPGRKANALARNPRVCIAVVSGAAFVRDVTPCQHGFAFRSVLMEGHATLLEDPIQRQQALRSLVMKYDESTAELPFEEATLAQTLVYAVAIDTLSYRERPRSGY
jgi:nitroimidazol reductase NimA-like FMN-containing flavoprotein (pyridoxamine 5'-phosphate oxidase superfamily)